MIYDCITQFVRADVDLMKLNSYSALRFLPEDSGSWLNNPLKVPKQSLPSKISKKFASNLN